MSGTRLSVWPPLNPGVYARRRALRLPYPLEDPRCRLFSRARHALRHALGPLGLQRGDYVLAPAYHHGSEIEALARAGVECAFYDASDTLAPDEAELDDLLHERVKALYLIHYLGFPQDGARWRRWCEERGLLLIEDAAQAWLAETADGPVGSFGHVAFFCLYKTFGLPDGAALIGRTPPTTDTAPGSLDLAGALKKHASWAEGRFARAADLAARMRESNGYDPERDFELGDHYRRPARATLSLLPLVVEEDAAARRRVNYEVLRAELADMVDAPFDEPHAGASPFAFPLAVEDKTNAIDRLTTAGVGALNFWSVPHPSLDAAAHPGAARRRARTVGLPVHQELRTEDLERVVDAVKPRRTRTPGIDFERLRDLVPLKREWGTLAEASRNIFSTWEWISTWVQHFARERDLVVGRLRRRNGTSAIVPLYEWSTSPQRVLRFLGHGPADQLGPVCDERDAQVVARALRRTLSESPDLCDVLLADYLPASQPWTQLMDARVLRRFQSPVLRFDGDWDQYLASRSRNFREQVRRRERKLGQEHDVSFRLVSDPGDLERDMRVLFDLYRARWGTDAGAFTDAAAFHVDFARVAADNGWLRLWFLELDGRPVAAWYGFRFAGAESFYQAGRDPRWADGSVGLVLLVHTIREALNDGIHEYRFLRGGEDYKYRFTDEDPGLETAAWARGPLQASGLKVAAALGNWSLARRLVGRRLTELDRG